MRPRSGPARPATYLNGTLRPQGELLQNYYAIGHNSLDNYIAQVSGQAPTEDTQADCADNGFAFANVEPGTPDPNQTVNPGQVDGEGCVYPSSVQTIANQLDAKYPPNPKTSVASWRGYDQDMGNTPSRDGGVPDPTGGTDCGAPGHRRARHGRVRHVGRPVHHPAQPVRLVPLDHRQHGGVRRQRRAPRDLGPQRRTRHPAGTWPGTCAARRPRPASPSSPPTSAATDTTAPCAGTNSTGGHAGWAHRVPTSSSGPGCR